MSYRFGQYTIPSFSFDSSDAGALTIYVGGAYIFFAGADNFAAGTSWGTSRSPYGAFLMLVLGEVPVDEITIRIAGTSWVPGTGTRTAGDSEDIVIPSDSQVDDYFQSAKMWIGLVTITQTAGTAKNCNYGWVTYWSNRNQQFFLKGLNLTGYGGANDIGADFILYHHKADGWTYNPAGEPTPPTPIAQFSTDYGVEHEVKTGEQFCWRDTSLSVEVAGNDGEGLIFAAIQTQARPFIDCNLLLRISSAR